MTNETLLMLCEAFLMGCSDLEACVYAGIGKSTLYDYERHHPEFSERKQLWKENPALQARMTLFKAIQKDPRIAMWYLERKHPEEFSLRYHVVHHVAPVKIQYIAPKTDYQDFSEQAERELKVIEAKMEGHSGT